MHIVFHVISKLLIISALIYFFLPFVHEPHYSNILYFPQISIFKLVKKSTTLVDFMKLVICREVVFEANFEQALNLLVAMVFIR